MADYSHDPFASSVSGCRLKYPVQCSPSTKGSSQKTENKAR